MSDYCIDCKNKGYEGAGNCPCICHEPVGVRAALGEHHVIKPFNLDMKELQKKAKEATADQRFIGKMYEDKIHSLTHMLMFALSIAAEENTPNLEEHLKAIVCAIFTNGYKAGEKQKHEK